jgi:RNA polymerase sigma-32 factor
MKVPMLTREREAELARLWAEDQDRDALNELIRAHMRLAISMAMKMARSGLPVSDLIQQANLGLVQAAERFDPARDVRFSTYAAWWIRSALQDHILRNWSVVRIGTNSRQKAIFFQLRRLNAAAAADGEIDKAQAMDEIAASLDVPVTDVEMLQVQVIAGDQSLDAPIGAESDLGLADMLPDDMPTPEETVIDHLEGEQRRAWLFDAIDELPEREKYIIRQRRLIEPPKTLKVLGDEIGVSKERIRQLERRAFDMLLKRATLEVEAD